ncbi:M23 family metallopeptidase, partial [Streptomyces sp. EN27]|uniref:peptidoglycan DD-metalloendopeptidase family protein n=1 Tax=Streptomyces sp. EN27 TaxID=211464 RepID=UPI00210D7ABD
STVRAQYGFAGGGIFGDIGSAIGSAGSSIASGVGGVLKKGTDAVRGTLGDLAAKAFKPIKKGITGALGSNVNTYPGMIGAALHRARPVRVRRRRHLRRHRLRHRQRRIIHCQRCGRGPEEGHRRRPRHPRRPGRQGVQAHQEGHHRRPGLQREHLPGDDRRRTAVNHGGGLQSLYAHMSAIAAKVGDGIQQGGRIGSEGATGNVTGPHLHLEARLNGKSIDPMPYLTGGGTGDGGSGVQRWKGVVTQALGQVHQSLGLVNTTLRRMNQESGGNPKAVNRTDSNWKAGPPPAPRGPPQRQVDRPHAL